MSDCLIVGMPNVGKTCFVVNFADYMGLKNLKFYIQQPEGYTSVKQYSISGAKNELVSAKANHTRDIQAVKLDIKAGKISKELKIVDTCGLSKGIHPNGEIRKAMAATLKQLQQSNIILHIIDITNISTNIPDRNDILFPIDRMILNFARIDKKYAVLVNKTDLKEFQANLVALKNKLKVKVIIPISALYQEGFRDVKNFILNYV